MTIAQRARARRRPPAGRESPSTLAVRIDELVLDGFDPADRYRIGDAAQAELSRLFERRDRTDLFGDAELDRVNAGSFTVPVGARPEMTGVHVARAVHESILDGASRGAAAASTRAVARQADDRPPPVERTMEVPPIPLWFNAGAVPECDRGQVYDPNWRRCRPPICSDFDTDKARQFVIQKLGETSKYIPPLAASIRRGQFARFFPAALEKELTAGADAVITKLKKGEITIVCPAKVAGAETDGISVRLPLFAAAGSPPWSQTLMNHVVLHECIHLICSNLPSQPGTDPYENAAKVGGDPASAMHADLPPIMTAFPLHIPKW